MAEAIFVGVLLLFLGLGAIGGVERLIWWVKRTWGVNVDCQCVCPRNYSPFGSTFVCPECARKWYSTHDNVCWAGWDWAPWWKRIQMGLALELPGRRKEADPIVRETVEKRRWVFGSNR